MTVKLVTAARGFKKQTKIDLETCPFPTVAAGGIGSYWLEIMENDQLPPPVMTVTNPFENPGKPPYRVPSMEEINAIPWNNYRIASTFSGAGGSCLGYRMAGFKVIWANEFVPIAQETYKANAAPDCYLDPRDIKLIKPEEILEVTGLKPGELDLFDGSPPCQAFSTAGKRDKGWGKAKKYEHGAEQCNEQLFDEYIRLLRGLRPKVFIAENVSGLVKGTAKGFFIEIIKALKASGYRVSCRVLDAQWLGVPQARQRTIFIGVREDLGLDPVHPLPLNYRYSVSEAIPHILDVRQSLFHGTDQRSAKGKPCPTITASGGVGAAYGNQTWVEVSKCEMVVGNEDFNPVWGSTDQPSPTILAAGGRTSGMIRGEVIEKRKFTIDELKRICAFPDDFVIHGSYSQQWERLGNSVPPVMMFHIAKTVRTQILDRMNHVQPAPGREI